MINKFIIFIINNILEKVKIKGLKIELVNCKDIPINDGEKETPSWISWSNILEKKTEPDSLILNIDSKNPNKSGCANTELIL